MLHISEATLAQGPPGGRGTQAGCSPGLPWGKQGPSSGCLAAGTLPGLRPGAGLGGFSWVGRVLFKGGWARIPEAAAGSLRGPEQGVGQCGRRNQSPRAEDGGGGHACLNLEKQQCVDGQRWERRWLSLVQSTSRCH